MTVIKYIELYEIDIEKFQLRYIFINIYIFKLTIINW